MNRLPKFYIYNKMLFPIFMHVYKGELCGRISGIIRAMDALPI